MKITLKRFGIYILPHLAASICWSSQPLMAIGKGTLGSICISEDGERFSTIGGGGAYIWDLESETVLRRFATEAWLPFVGPEPIIRLNGSGSLFAVAEPIEIFQDGGFVTLHRIRLFDVGSGRLIGSSHLHMETVTDIAFADSVGLMASSAEDDTARIWDVRTMQPIRVLQGHTDDVNYVSFSGDGTRVVTASADGTARVWNTADGSPLRTITPAFANGRAVLNDSGSRLVTSGSPIEVWETATGQKIEEFTVDGQVVYFEGDLIKFAGSNSIYLGIADTGQISQSYPVTYPGSSSRLSRDLRIAAGDLGGTVTIQDADDGWTRTLYSGHSEKVTALDLRQEFDQLISGGDRSESGGYAYRWSYSSGRVLDRITLNTGSVSALHSWPDGLGVTVGTGKPVAGTWTFTGSGVHSWQFATGLDEYYMTNPNPDDQAIALMSMDIQESTGGLLLGYGSFLSNYSQNRYAYLYDMAPAVVPSPWYHSGDINSVGFSEDGTKFFTASEDGYTKVWNRQSGGLIANLNCLAPVRDAQFLDSGALIATANSWGNVSVWDTATGSNVENYESGSELICMAVNQDETYILSGNIDGGVSLWKRGNSLPLERFEEHDNQVSSLVFEPGGLRFLSGAFDGRILRWELFPPRVIIVAGSGDYPGNAIAEQTKALAHYAQDTLRARGYEDIVYLSAFSDEGETATLDSLRDTITGSYGSGAGRLMIVLIGHGHRTGSFMAYRLNRNEALRTTVLDEWLDEIQNRAPVDVTLLVDCCYSGQIALDCRKDASIPTERQRIIITSTSPEAEAVFLQPPDLTSFVYTFLSSAYMGNSLGEAFRAGERFFSLFPVANQVPQLDDGTASFTKANREFLGAAWDYGIQSDQDVNEFFPVFDQFGIDATTPGEPVRLWVRTLPAENPLSLVATIRPPAPAVISGDPVTELPSVELQQSEPGLWERTITDETFLEEGTYVVSYSARFPFERLSGPAITSVTISSGIDPDATPIRAILAVGEGDAFQTIGSDMYSIYLDRFQDNAGAKRFDWIEFLTPYGLRFEGSDRTLKDFEKRALETLNDRGERSATANEVLSAINSVDAETSRLYVHLLSTDAREGEALLDQGTSLSAVSLDQALDNYQSSDPEREVILIIDGPGSGSFIASCSGTNRIIMTSGSSEDSAVFDADSRTSFTSKVLNAAWQGNNLADSFASTHGFFAYFLSYFTANITPLIDDNGDGVANSADGGFAAQRWLGRRYAFAGDDAAGLPFILGATVIANGADYVLTAKLMEGVTPSRVFADVYTSESITGTPREINLSRVPGEMEVWHESIVAPLDLPAMAIVYAAYPDQGGEKLSEPFFVPVGIDPESSNWSLY